MTRVKICGITCIEDALHAAALGADAVGFVFYPKSHRYVAAEKVREIIAGLPPLVITVGLFVNEAPQVVRETVLYCGLDRVQLHGEEDPRLVGLPPRRVIKAIRVRDAASLSDPGYWGEFPLLLDAWSEHGFGGSGETFDWQLAARMAERYPIILAGGLNPRNVREAIAAVRPYGVDVASGVEREPGLKDPDKVAAFLQAAKGKNHV